MRKNFLIVFCLVITFLFGSANLKAESKISFGDTTCCAPDSLTVISTNYPVFCVSWHIPNDSLCKKFERFVIQWKLLLSNNWETQIVSYTSGSYINFCDSVDICGVYQWRVRTKCNDSLYSNWVYGNKFAMSCDSGGRYDVRNLSISPNPASENITISTNDINSGQVKISVVNMNGRNVFDKMAYAQSGQLRERISVAGWQRGIYFVGIFADGVLINRGSFVKE